MTQERQPAFLWDGRPVYRCQACAYERVENLAAVLEHELEAHGPLPPVVRESPILGPDGEKLMVEEEQEVAIGRLEE